MNRIIQLGNIRDGTKSFSDPQTGRIYSMYGISPTLNTCQGGGARNLRLLWLINQK